MASNIQSSVQETLPLAPILMSQTRRQTVPDTATRIPMVVEQLIQWKTDYADEGEICPICFESRADFHLYIQSIILTSFCSPRSQRS